MGKASQHRQGAVVLYLGFSVYLVLQQYPLNAPSTIFFFVTGAVYLFTLTPWFQYTLRWFPYLLLFLFIVAGIILIYPALQHQSVDYAKLFAAFSIMLILIVLMFAGRRIRIDETTHETTLQVGQTTIPQTAGGTTDEKPIVDLNFLGVSLRVFRYGKFTQIKISTDE